MGFMEGLTAPVQQWQFMILIFFVWFVAVRFENKLGKLIPLAIAIGRVEAKLDAALERLTALENHRR